MSKPTFPVNSMAERPDGGKAAGVGVLLEEAPRGEVYVEEHRVLGVGDVVGVPGPHNTRLAPGVLVVLGVGKLAVNGGRNPLVEVGQAEVLPRVRDYTYGVGGRVEVESDKGAFYGGIGLSLGRRHTTRGVYGVDRARRARRVEFVGLWAEVHTEYGVARSVTGNGDTTIHLRGVSRIEAYKLPGIVKPVYEFTGLCPGVLRSHNQKPKHRPG